MEFSDRGEDAVSGRERAVAGGESREELCGHRGIGNGRCVLRAGYIAGQISAEASGGEGFSRVDGIGNRRQTLVGCDLLELMGAVVEPDAQPDILLLQGAWRDRRHVRERRIAQQHRIEPLAHGQVDCGGGCGSPHAGAVVAPVGGRAVCVDEGELELPVAIEIHTLHGDAALVVERLGQGGRGDAGEHGR